MNKKRGLNEDNDVNIIDVISADYLNELNEDEKSVKTSDVNEKVDFLKLTF